jgi:hypothetical protein
LRRLLGVALAVALCCACSAAKSAAPSATAKPAEAPTVGQWLGRYGLWVTDLRIALEHRDRQALSLCAKTLDRKLGNAPGPLRGSEHVLAHACGRFERGARMDDSRRAFTEWSQAARLIRAANGSLPHPQAMERLPLPVAAWPTGESRVEPTFTRVANDVAAPASQVRCWSRSDWSELQKESFGKDLNLAGFASPQYKRVNLAWDMCDGLATLAYTSERPSGTRELEIAFAVTTLMHEAGHLNESGDFYGAGANEPLAECWGMQHIRVAAVELGTSRAYANELAARYWAEVYPTRTPAYRTKKCRNGGAYDINKESDMWP